jgi:hypothetical protein
MQRKKGLNEKYLIKSSLKHLQMKKNICIKWSKLKKIMLSFTIFITTAYPSLP